MRIPPRVLMPLLAAACLAGCRTDTTEPGTDPAVASLVQRFNRVADSLAASGADPGFASVYRDVGALLLRGGRVTPVTIALDGVPTEYLATAQQTTFEAPRCDDAAVCAAGPASITSLIAWQRTDPTRVVQLTVGGGAGRIDDFVLGTPVSSEPRATITLLEGRGAAYVGYTRIASLVGTPRDGSACSSPRAALETVSAARCSPSDFVATFSGGASPVSGVLGKNAASGTHTLSMASQQVAGVQLTFTQSSCSQCVLTGFPTGALPPLPSMPGDALRATLSAATGAQVALTLTVTNAGTTPATIQFNGGQQYDFIIASSSSPAPLWRWSADRGFTAALSSRTLAPGETVSYRESWSPTATGRFVATGSLTSTSHRASASTVFTVP